LINRRVCSCALALFLVGCAGTGRLGWVDRTVFDDPAYPEFKAVYDTTHVANEFVELITKVQDEVDVSIFFGLWCSDSKKQIPRFLKIMDLAEIPQSRVKFYALDRSKKSADGATDYYGIQRVPTFIFLKKNVEVGRIVEVPRTTMEADVLSILAAAQTR
jgi:thiol-disulfide isomerase/thioredoxin